MQSVAAARAGPVTGRPCRAPDSREAHAGPPAQGIAFNARSPAAHIAALIEIAGPPRLRVSVDDEVVAPSPLMANVRAVTVFRFFEGYQLVFAIWGCFGPRVDGSELARRYRHVAGLVGAAAMCTAFITAGQAFLASV